MNSYPSGEDSNRAGKPEALPGRIKSWVPWGENSALVPPEEIARYTENTGSGKGTRNRLSTMAMAFLAGIFIAIGAEFYTVVVHDPVFGMGLTQFFGGIAFSLGVALVIATGAGLFASDTFTVTALAQNKISWQELLRIWGLVYIGNFLGALMMALLMYATQQFTMNEGLVGARALLIASNKVSSSFGAALCRGIVGNALITLAFWLSLSARRLSDKVIVIALPVAAFVGLGFEHCVANMYLIPMAMLLKGQAPLVELAERMGNTTINLQLLSAVGLGKNLIPVTMGNIIGSALLLSPLWFTYLKKSGIFPIPRLLRFSSSLLPSALKPEYPSKRKNPPK